jgi:hypothetical protein
MRSKRFLSTLCQWKIGVAPTWRLVSIIWYEKAAAYPQ